MSGDAFLRGRPSVLGRTIKVNEVPATVIGVIGLISDVAFKALNQMLFPWALRGR